MTDLDLTPREVPTSRSGGRRNWLIVGVLAVVGAFVLYQALTSARVYFLNVDEAVARRAELGDDTFNMQGTVVTEPVSSSDAGGAAGDEAMRFSMTFGGETAEVVHIGAEPTDLFKVGEQVVAKGHWEGGEFVSNQLLVKHSEEYVEDNPDRLNDAADDADEIDDSGAVVTTDSDR